MAAAMNGNGNGHPTAAPSMAKVFPEALKTLEDVDPELYSIIEDEKRRQW
jgi:hypothetical protein